MKLTQLTPAEQVAQLAAWGLVFADGWTPGDWGNSDD